MADMHFDMPFTSLENYKNLGDQRRLEQREIFKKAIEIIKQNNIPYLFISGDLYENEYVKESTINFINNNFEEISNTKIFISPGNHDPYLKDSYYNKTKWSKNVYIFKGKIEKIELPEANIYGAAFTDFYAENLGVENIDLDKSKLNILVIHGTLDGWEKAQTLYNPVSKKMLEEKGFDYVALGHIHKTNYNKNNIEKIIYPGSCISQGFDELGEHGVITRRSYKRKFKARIYKIR